VALRVALRATMIRQAIIELALFIAPFAAYALYLWAARAGVIDVSAWSPLRIMWLTAGALTLVIAGFAVLAQFGGAPPGSTYVPAHMENGRFVPGIQR
jgi:Family of unknown function (DUF6111)